MNEEIEELCLKIRELEVKNARYKIALEKYAHRENWSECTDYMGSTIDGWYNQFELCRDQQDGGVIAREALDQDG